MPRTWAWLILLVAGCRGGSALELELSATPSTVLYGLTLDATLTEAGDGGARHETFSWLDGGVTLPTTFRLLVDATHADVQALGFDGDGGAHLASGSVDLEAGAAQRLTLELSVSAACPAGPSRPGEAVIFDEDVATGYQALGFRAARLTAPSTAAPACTGSKVLEYLADTQFVDGFGVKADSPVKPRHLSLRAWASRSSTWVFELNNPATGASAVLPDPANCTADQPRTCLVTLGPVWQRFEFDVPDGVPAMTQLFAQFQDPTTADPITARLDDLRASY